MKRKLFTAFILFILLTFNTRVAAAESFHLDVDSCILIDSKTGQILYNQNADAKGMYPASTTKIMTAILALENGSLDQVMTASQKAVNDIGRDGMNIGIMAGEEITLEYLLHALLISSANETANIIAENICSSREEFIELMNKRALELGAKDTHFVNTNGMHNDNHYTTASDLAKIARYAMTLPKFREIVSKTEYTMLPTNKHESWPTLYSTNKLLRYGTRSDLFKINGIKTGYTSPAGYCFVSSAVYNDGMELIGVILGDRNTGVKDSVFKCTEQLMEYGNRNYSLQTLIKQGEVIREDVDVLDAQLGKSLDLIAENAVECVLPADTSLWNLSRIEYIKSDLAAPISRGEILGHIEYFRNGISLGRTNIVASEPVFKKEPEESGSTADELLQDSLFKNVLITVACIIGGFLLLRITLRTISRRIKARRYGNW